MGSVPLENGRARSLLSPRIFSPPMTYLLILIAAAARLLPHPPNLVCVGALGLFAGCYLAGRRAFLVPLAAMLFSDVVGHLAGIGGVVLYNPIAMACVYAGLLAAVPIGRMISASDSWGRVPAGSLAASLAFFLISNFGVWMSGWYSYSPAGLMICYVNAIPFFGPTVIGDLAFSTLIFGVYAVATRPVLSVRGRIATA